MLLRKHAAGLILLDNIRARAVPGLARGGCPAHPPGLSAGCEEQATTMFLTISGHFGHLASQGLIFGCSFRALLVLSAFESSAG